MSTPNYRANSKAVQPSGVVSEGNGCSLHIEFILAQRDVPIEQRMERVVNIVKEYARQFEGSPSAWPSEVHGVNGPKTIIDIYNR